MRDFNKVSTTLWRSRKFRSLPNDACRMAYLYLLTGPHGNSAGCFDLHPMYACADLGWSPEAYGEAINSLSSAGLIAFDAAENTVLIVNWDEFNEPTNPKHAIGLIAQLQQASSPSLKFKAFQAFVARFKAKGFDRDASLRKAMDIFLIPYRKPIATETETEIETEIETRPDLDKTETRENPRAALRTVAAEGRDGLAQPSQPPNVSRLLQTKLMKQGP
jgi:hypothetical protein